MPTSEFRMPSLGADMDVGRLVEWKVQAGQDVHRGDLVATVETDKGAIDVEIWEDGVIDELVVELDEEVPVGTVLARLTTSGVAAKPPRDPPPRDPPPPQTRSSALPPPAPGPLGPKGPPSSPSARRLARELGIDLGTVTGTGPHGAIKRNDVAQAAGSTPSREEPKPASPPTRKESKAAGASMRRAIAAAVTRSKREIPHYYLHHDVLMDPALDWLERTNATRPPAERLLLAALLIRATAVAASEHPQLNGFWREGLHPSEQVHVGFAIALRGGGLVAPALHDADAADVDATMRSLRDLVKRARSGGLRSSELSEGTITISSLGEQGVDGLFGVIQPPQVALVGFGCPRPRPWAVDGLLGVRRVLRMTLSADHRASDGHRGALFLRRIAELLLDPATLAGPGGEP